MKSIILTLTSARAGARMLYKNFLQVPNLVADHESTPGFCSVRKENITDPSVGREFVKKFVYEYINSLPGLYYANTDQSCSNGFVEHFLDIGLRPSFVVLRRNPRQAALSMFKLNWIPARHYLHRQWYSSPEEPNALACRDWQTLHNYQLCYWYICDCERRIQNALMLIKELNCLYWETTPEEISITDNFNSMLCYFKLPQVEAIAAKKFNTLNSLKLNQQSIPDSFLFDLEQDVLDRIPQDFASRLKNDGWARE